MAVENYRELIAWQKAMDLVETVYKITYGFPREELYCLTSQVRKAVISIPSNIAEGQCRWSTREFIQFLSIAHGSLGEVETQLLIGQRLRYLDEKNASAILDQTAEVGRLVNGLANSLPR
jgi:four helix bundle protein